jgi:uncharacterized protein YlxW (UPF0749 family)
MKSGPIYLPWVVVMSKKSFIDLTALLDVVLILFFAALINMANSAELDKETKNAAEAQLQEQVQENQSLQETVDVLEAKVSSLDEDLHAHKAELVDLYGSEIEDLKDHQEILSKISIIEIVLTGENNELIINDGETNIHILKERLLTEERTSILEEDLITALNDAIDSRDKSDIIFMKVSVADREVYKYAYDYLLDVVNKVINDYGKDKVMLSKEFD